MLWYTANAIVFDSWLLPSSVVKRVLLRLFGAKVGARVVIKPRVNIKHPWRLRIGDDSWIGEGVWIDNLLPVVIGANVCVSQGAFLCTGNHDWNDPHFRLRAEPIRVMDHVWIAAFSQIGPGVVIATGAVISAGSRLFHDAKAWTVYSSSDLARHRTRSLKGSHWVRRR